MRNGMWELEYRGQDGCGGLLPCPQIPVMHNIWEGRRDGVGAYV